MPGQIRARIRKLSNTVVEGVALESYIITFFLIIILFGVIYWWLTPFGHGMRSSTETLPVVSFSESCYFSLTTITSFGFSEYYPQGYSKIVVTIEVLIGLIMMGVMLAKLTSSRLSHHVSRVYSAEVQRRLSEFVREIQSIKFSISENWPNLNQSFSEVPKLSRSSSGNSIWLKCLNEMSKAVTQEELKTWLRPLDVKRSDDNSFHIYVPNEFVSEFVKRKFGTVINEALEAVLGFAPRVQYLVSNDFQSTEQSLIRKYTGSLQQDIGRFRNNSVAFSEFVEFENSRGALFSNTPVQSLSIALEEIEELVNLLGQVILSIPHKSRREIIDQDARRNLNEAIARIESIAITTEKDCKIDSVIKVSRNLSIQCKSFSNCYFGESIRTLENSLPDQRPIERSIISTTDNQEEVGELR